MGAPRLIAWADADQERLVRDAAEAAEAEIVAVCAPSSSDAAALATSLDVERIGDLRTALQRENVDLVWLAARAALSDEERRLITPGTPRVFSNEPRPVEFARLRAQPDVDVPVIFVPRFRRAAGPLAATEALAEIGPLLVVDVIVGGRPEEGSLLARLFDALDLVQGLAGAAESVDASLSGPLANVPETLIELTGHLAAHVRLTGPGTASVTVSDRASAWIREATVIGANGRVQLTDAGYGWIDTDGVVQEAEDVGAAPTFAGLVAREMHRSLQKLDTSTVPPPRTADLLALAEAARVSCRTRSGEQPRLLAGML